MRPFLKTVGWLLAVAGPISAPATLYPRRPPGPEAQSTSVQGPAALPAIQFDKTGFSIDGKPFTLVSGEFHYFRVPKKDWKTRMALFKAAGGNCLATYIPWLIHEPEEGRFVFDTGDGIHDLEAFLQTAKKEGLYVIARPGPYQYSELKYSGLPGWLVERYPEIRAKDAAGKDLRPESVSYVHPLFLEKAKKWYGRVCPILKKYTLLQGGPVAFVQLDNEMIGIHAWYGSIDYNPASMGFGKREGRYTEYLWRKFQNVERLNHDYGGQYTVFHQVLPPKPDGPPNEFELRFRKDYADFYLETVAEYASTLAQWIRGHGIEVPLVHNAAGPTMNALFLETASRLGVKSFLLGSDHYYNLGPDWPQNNPTPQYGVDAFCSLETLRLMGYPPTVFELPSGSCFDWPPILPEDARACYMTNLAFGMKGFNYYIFTGGPNPPGTGTTGDLYDYGAPVGADGEVRPLYRVQKEFHALLQKYPWLAAAERDMDCRFAMDFEYLRSDRYWRSRGGYALTNSEAWDFLRRGALTSAFCAGLSPAFVNLGTDDFLGDTETPLVVIASPSMAASKQIRLVEFLRKGGKVLLAPVVPVLDDRFNECDILAEFLGRPQVEPIRQPFPRVGFEGVPNVAKTETFCTKTVPKGAVLIAEEETSKKPVAWSLKTDGNGMVTFLGLLWKHGQNEQHRMVKMLLDRLGMKQKVTASNPAVWVSVRKTGNRAMLFVLNLYSSPQETLVEYRPDGTGKPKFVGDVRLNAMEVKTIAIRP